MAEHIAHIGNKKTYVTIWIILLCFTALTTGVAFIDLGALNTVVALAIAVCKAALVVMFFMHVRHSEGLIRVIVVLAVFWLAILIVVSYADFSTRKLISTPSWLGNQAQVSRISK
ncbi:MAG TPA: cytochrome C oxidase subunit IV family protein [Terriglobia bacterium]|nr:cytochrome C oxidase subunit IV family protein [Terriglobia bacterium]